VSSDQIDVLLVEDDPDDALLIREMLSESDTASFKVEHVQRLESAMEEIQKDSYGVILLDLTLPDSMGLDTFRDLHEQAEHTPIVVLTGLDDEAVGMEALRAGAQDYLMKGDVNSSLLVRALRYAIERQRLETRLAQALKRLDREFEIIANVQKSLLPSEVPQIPGFQLTTHYQPAEWAGGDYFDFLPLGNAATGVLLADVSGRGAPAAVLMAMTRVIVHASENWSDPQAVLDNLNQELSANIPSGTFVTGTCGVLNYAQPEPFFDFACAGHTPPLLFETQSGDTTFLDVKARFPLGVQSETVYPRRTIQLKPGSALILFTDGVTNAVNPAGKAFGQDGLARALERGQPRTSEEICDAILHALQEHSGGDDLKDDTTLVIIQAEDQH
jgi:sigma-B regulation protein RsbU (phosphoserine phosphatase)